MRTLIRLHRSPVEEDVGSYWNWLYTSKNNLFVQIICFYVACLMIN
jgi:hypothetical protein